ncbi:hypothetical protein ACFE04_019189 [Oxalis oulophora]
MAQLHSPDSEFDEGDHVYDQTIVIPNKSIISATDEKKDNLWFVSSQIPTDLTIHIQDINFSVHKYPLVAKCGYIGQLELQPSISNFGYDLKLENFPGGAETFENILKFCYGLPVDLNPNNIAKLRCASEYLEMTEEFDDGNLIAKTEAFLTLVVLSSWKDTITVLKSCETLSPWGENLQIVRRCCDSISWKASRENSTNLDTANGEGWWIDDVTTFRIDHFTRILTSLKAKGAKPEIVGKCIKQYAERWLPIMNLELEGIRGYRYGLEEIQFSILSGRKEEVSVGHNKEQRMIIESLISLLPSQHKAVSCEFLLQLLRMAMMHSVSPALISELEKNIGLNLEDATVNDLLIPNYKYRDHGKLTNSQEKCTMHDIDAVQRIVDYFLIHEQQNQQQRSGKSNVSKLLDNYLAEVAKDPNLSITQFHVLTESLPANSRTCDDGLYRSIDTYLKTHPSLSEHDRKRLCKIMNCEKLSLDACTHAAQNDRLPIRTVVQVLFSEQVKMRAAMQGKETEPRGNDHEMEENQSRTSMDIKTLKVELANVKEKMAELQNDYSELQHEYEKLNNKQQKKSSAGWSLGWRKIKHSFHVKPEGDEFGDANHGRSSNSRVSYRRRESVS